MLLRSFFVVSLDGHTRWPCTLRSPLRVTLSKQRDWVVQAYLSVTLTVTITLEVQLTVKIQTHITAVDPDYFQQDPFEVISTVTPLGMVFVLHHDTQFAPT